MKISVDPADKTSYLQSLAHIIKGNMGAAILSLPACAKHSGLLFFCLELPILCLSICYALHRLISSAEHVESKLNTAQLDYSELTRGAFQIGPKKTRPYANAMHTFVDLVLIFQQAGICCVYLLFVVDNVTAIFASYDIYPARMYLFLALLPVAILLSNVKTLQRLAIASACANLMQIVGLCVVVQFLIRDMPREPQVEYFRPASEVALGYGTAMFAFEGVSIVLPVYARLKRKEQMNSAFGVVNVAYLSLLAICLLVAILGYLKFGSNVADTITLNLPNEPLYDVVRTLFIATISLSYPLQFYVLAEVLWGYIGPKLVPLPELEFVDQKSIQYEVDATSRAKLSRYENVFRTVLVLITFVLAVTVPKLTLAMDFIGSNSGAALSLVLPALIHLVAFWESTSGGKRVLMVAVDMLLIIFGVVGGACGSYYSFMEMVRILTLENPAVEAIVSEANSTLTQLVWN